MFRYQLTSNSN